MADLSGGWRISYTKSPNTTHVRAAHLHDPSDPDGDTVSVCRTNGKRQTRVMVPLTTEGIKLPTRVEWCPRCVGIALGRVGAIHDGVHTLTARVAAIAAAADPDR